MRQDLKSLIVIILLFFVWEVTAEEVPNGTIYGHVYDAATKQPLSQSFVYCQEVKCSKPTTNGTGYYTTDPCFSPSKTYTIQCIRHEYETSSKTIETDAKGNAEANFFLAKVVDKEKSDEANTWLIKGNNLFNQGNYDDAAPAYEKAIDLNPSIKKEKWHDIGFAFLEAKRYQEAVDIYDEILASDPSNIDALLEKGIALRKSSKINEAIECFDKILDENPRNSLAWNNKAFCLMNSGREDESIQCFDKAIEYAGSNDAASAYYDNKGNALFKMGQSEEALKAYDKAIESSPGFVNPQLDKIVALRKLSRVDEANGLQNKYGHATELIDDWEKNCGQDH